MIRILYRYKSSYNGAFCQLYRYIYVVVSLLWHGYSIIKELEGFCSEIVKSTDENGNTPLHLACSYGFVEVAEHLIKGDSDIEARYYNDTSGVSCFYIIINYILIAHLFRNAVRRTPIGCAAFHGRTRVIELLVSFKANIDPKDKLKNTPLQLAAKEGHVTAVEALLNHQASMTSLDQRKFNALDWAIENGHRYMCVIMNSGWYLVLGNIMIHYMIKGGGLN